MNAWLETVAGIARRGEDSVAVTVAAVRGSAPREPGAKMIVTREHVADTVGGGNLELACIERAREMLAPRAAPRTQLVRYPLGPGLGQCCGGVATVLFERIAARETGWLAPLARLVQGSAPALLVTGVEGTCRGRKLVAGAGGHDGTLGAPDLDVAAARQARELLAGGPDAPVAALRPVGAPGSGELALFERVRPADFHIALFGAGHVGRALVHVLAVVDCRVTWIDPRAAEFPPELPANARAVVSAAPEREAERAPSGAFHLVMTHSHALDFEICERVLKRGDFAYLGLIGSVPKRNRFLKCLALEGVPKRALERLTCPIGVAGVRDKQPAAIAIAVAAELLQVREAARGRAVGAASGTEAR